MKRVSFLWILIFTFCQVSFGQNKEQVLKKVWAAVGGKSAFEKARYWQFSFSVERAGQVVNTRNHIWDRYTGDYRLTSPSSEGKTMTILFNINTRKGKAFENQQLLSDSLTTKLINKAYASFINDSYWLMVPLKLQDPGVNTTLDSAYKINDVLCDVIHLNFDKVGLTPGDQYWLYVNQQSGEIVQWKFLLQGQKDSSIFEWSPYQQIGGGIKLSTKKTNKGANFAITFPVAKILTNVPKDIFIKP